MSGETIQGIVAGVVTLATSLVAVRAGTAERADHGEVVLAAPDAEPVSVEPPATGPAEAPVARARGSSSRPRILTGEPAAAAEQRKPAMRRALKLVAWIAVLAAAGAFGLLAFVRAVISLFDRISG